MNASAKPPSLGAIHGTVAWLVIALLGGAAALSTYIWAERRGFGRLADAGAHQLDLYAAGIESEFAKYETLPSILELDPSTFELLRRPDDNDLRDRLSRSLLNLNVRAGSLSIMLMDAHGRVLAASDWYEPHSLIGQALSMEPFFVEAVSGGQARVLVASGPRRAPECYFARPVVQRGRVVGAVAVRVSLESIESTWIEHAAGTYSEKLLVIDDDGVIIMSSNPDWRYRTLPSLARPASAARRAAHPAREAPLGLDVERQLGYGAQLLQLPDSIRPTQRFVSQEHAMVRPSWRLMTLSDTAPATRDAIHAALGAAALGGLVGVLGLYTLLWRRALALQLASREALQNAKDELELRVQERTAELSGANSALVNEIAERRRTEADLRQTQGELVRTGRLALLGRMSAAITHEINQPLTALRALADNCLRLLRVGRTQEIERHMVTIGALTERMGRITQQLKSFARSSPTPAGPVRLALSVQNALQLLRERLQQEDIDIHVDVDGGLRVLCDGYRIEQVLVNLIANAADAMKGRPLRRLSIVARVEDERALVRVADTGGGIPGAVLARLFEPFFSTKPPGEGLGLGLVISSGIVREFGGSLDACNGAEGAEFEFALRLERDA